MNRPALEMPDILAARIQRGMMPSSQEWVSKKEDPQIILNRMFGEWIQDVSKNEGLFKKHVYENDDIDELDLRQHRARLCQLISAGELLVMGFIALMIGTGNKKDILPVVQTIDQTVKKLSTAFFKWHAPAANQTDIPDDLKQSIQELEEGKVVDLDI